ncbi:hypothetical protein CYMTET_35398, partial [Cymbomonas tetramitiformis]
EVAGHVAVMRGKDTTRPSGSQYPRNQRPPQTRLGDPLAGFAICGSNSLCRHTSEMSSLVIQCARAKAASPRHRPAACGLYLKRNGWSSPASSL